tara:strand:+ start:3517 stop:4551 length:1035 start_codon:yes stop_codon:yes gene_type:complete
MSTVFEPIVCADNTIATETDKDKYYVNGFGEIKLKPKFISYEIEMMGEKHYYFGNDYYWYVREMKDVLACDSCCDRHQTKKPSLDDLNLPNMFNGIYEPGDNRKIDFDLECNCNCRHNARMLCFNNNKKYNMLKDLALRKDNVFEIKRLSEMDSGFNEIKKPIYEDKIPYHQYDEYHETDYDMVDGTVTLWEIVYCFLIRINDKVYDIHVRHSSYDEDYLDELGVDRVTGEYIADNDIYDDKLELLRVIIIADDDPSSSETSSETSSLNVLQKEILDLEKQVRRAKLEEIALLEKQNICRTCKAKSGIKKYYYNYCSFDCVHNDPSTWTDYGESSEEDEKDDKW